MRFKEFMRICEWDDSKAIYVPSSWTNQGETGPDSGSGDTMQPYLPRTDLALPQTDRTAEIRYIDEKKNPIFVFLADGTQLFLPYDAFKRIKGDPQPGRMMTISFQRRPDDKSGSPSQIQSITVH